MSGEHATVAETKGGFPSPGKIFAYCLAFGVGFIVLSVGAPGFFDICRSISMGVDMLTKPILTLVVIGGIAGMIFAKKVIKSNY